MRRRAFLATPAALLAATALATPQARGRPRRVGVLSFGAAEPFVTRLRVALADLGHRDGQDVVIEARAAEGRIERVPELAAELVQMRVDVIVANATPSIQAVAAATRTIPIVMATAGDALRTRHVASLARPGGNLTGLTLSLIELAGKTVGMLHEALPRARRIACMVHRDDPLHAGFLAEAQASARQLGLQFVPVTLERAADVEPAFAALARDGVQGAIVQPILILSDGQRERIVRLQLEHRIAAISGLARFAHAGGFMAYASEFPDLPERSASYVDRILRGANPATLPVERPKRFELLVNAGTARTLGIVVPAPLLARADGVIA